MSPSEEPKNSSVQSVDRAFTLLVALGRLDRPATVTELSLEMGVHKSTVSRLLSTMASHRLVEQDPETQKYRLGLKMLDLSSRVLSDIPVRGVALPYLRELAQSSSESVHLGILDAGQIIYIEKLESDGSAPMYSHIGLRVPLHCSAMGKAILAFKPVEEARALLAQSDLGRRTAHTICAIDHLMAVLGEVRATGYSLDDEENEIGIRCVGAPVFDRSGNVVAAISLSGPALRVEAAKAKGLADRVRRTGLAISAALGFTGGE